MSPNTLVDLVDGFAARGRAIAIARAGSDESGHWSYQELHDHVVRVARTVHGENLDRNRPIGVLGENSPNWIATLLAIAYAGRIALPLNVLGSDDELKIAIDHSGCRHLFTTSSHAERLVALLDAGRVELLRLDEHDEKTEGLADLETSNGSATPGIAEDDIACLLYTSGTTGKPKGVPLSHGNLTSNVRSLIDAKMAGPQDRILVPLPLHHAYPLTVGVLSPLACGTTVVLPERMSGRAIKAALIEEECTLLLGVPRLYEALLGALFSQLAQQPRVIAATFESIHSMAAKGSALLRPLARELMAPVRKAFGPKLRIAACGGAKLDEDHERALNGLGFEVLTGYGLTETSPIATFNPPGRSRIGTAGKPVQGVEIRIEKAAADDQSGAVWIKGPNVFRGYWGEPPGADEDLTAEGWYRTGDLGFVDDDGYLHLVGRQKEILVLSGGKNVIPDSIEKRFMGLEGVSEVAAIERDGRLELIVVPEAHGGSGGRGEQSGGDRADALKTAVRAAAKQGPSYAQPSSIHIVRKKLPRTLIGKLKRHELQALLEEESRSPGERTAKDLSPEDEGLLRTAPAGEIYEWLGERYKDRDVSLDASPQFDLGFDSFEWMNVALVLEDRFDVVLMEDELAEVETVRDLLERCLDAHGREREGRNETEFDERWIRPRGPATRASAHALRDSNRFAMSRLFALDIEGAENIPAEGPFVVTANHQSHLDSFAIAAALTPELLERTYWAGATKVYFKGPLIRRFSRIANLLPIENDFGSFSALDYGRRVLERGDVLVWYPEGHRTRDGALLKFRPGVGVLMAELGVPALPIVLHGTLQAMPAGSKLPRFSKLRLACGPLVTPAELLGREVGEDTMEEGRNIVEALRRTIETMLRRHSFDGGDRDGG